MDNHNIIDDINNMVQSAIDSKNFATLNSGITESVNRALDELKKQLSYKAPPGAQQQQPQQKAQNSASYTTGYAKEPEYKQKHFSFMSSQTIAYKPPVRTNTAPAATASAVSENAVSSYGGSKPPGKRVFIPVRRVGSIKGAFMHALGLSGIILSTIAAFVLFVVSAAGGFTAPALVAISLVFFMPLWIAVAARGSFLRKRLIRFQTYLFKLQEKGFVSISELARTIGRSNSYCISDLQKMLYLGMFPEGHFDEKYTCFIATDSSYRQYLAAQESCKASHPESGANNPSGSASSSAACASSDNTVIDESKIKNDRVNAVIKEGNEYIRKIRHINDELPDEEISAKLDRLEITIEKIFQHVDRHPEQLPELDKFMQYYLPTTLKLLTVYHDFDKQPIQGENISTAKQEILGTLDTINQAFVKLFDSLFQATAWDVSTDISVLETMLAQEGLTQGAFETKGEQ